MDKTDIPGLAQKMIDAVRGFVAKAEEALNGRIDAIEARIAAIPRGEKGEKGDPGDRGEAGQHGAEGQRGEKGEPGEKGMPGDGGAPGEKGDPGQPGERGEKGDAGADGKDGKDGRDGRDGKDGTPGRDAAELAPLPAIDEARSYPAGTWAHHAGGLIRAERATVPVRDGDLQAAGWAVMVEGVAAVVVTQGEDPREIEVASMLTSGTKAVCTFSIPMVIDRGVWREGEHEKGDHVTWDGSGWIAQRKTATKPGTGPDWRLSTKRGRDGKDGAAPPAPRGPVRTP